MLTKERVQFREERERFKEENESLHKKAANTEPEKAELRDALEEQASKLRECRERYEKELNKVRAELQNVKKEIQERKDQVYIVLFSCNMHGMYTLYSFRMRLTVPVKCHEVRIRCVCLIRWMCVWYMYVWTAEEHSFTFLLILPC